MADYQGALEATGHWCVTSPDGKVGIPCSRPVRSGVKSQPEPQQRRYDDDALVAAYLPWAPNLVRAQGRRCDDPVKVSPYTFAAGANIYTSTAPD